jgi:hypothetical protein
VSFSAITLGVAFQRVVIVVICFVMTQSGNFWIYPRINSIFSEVAISLLTLGSLFTHDLECFRCSSIKIILFSNRMKLRSINQCTVTLNK